VNLGFLWRAWLKQQAQAGLRESLAHAAAGGREGKTPAGRTYDGEKGAKETGEGIASEHPQGVHDTNESRPRPCDVGFVFALSIEMGGWEDLLEGIVSTHAHNCLVRQGGFQGRSIALVCSGPGRQAAARATQALIAGHRPRWIISAGFAGGLRANVRQGDVIMADRLTDISGTSLAIDLKVDPRSVAQTAGLHVGRILTVDKIVSRPREKLALGRAHDALCVDMASWAVGEVCRQDKVRFMAIRVISDAVDDELPCEIDNLLRQKSRAGTWGAVAGALWRRPSSAKDMLRLKQDALANSDRLARFLAQVVVQLTPTAAANESR